MADIPASLTHVFTQSPQVTTLVAGEAATAENIRHLNQVKESKRQQEDLKSKVLSAESSGKIGQSDEEVRRKLEDEAKLQLKQERRRKRQGRKVARAADEGKRPQGDGCAVTPFESKQVIDVCV